MSESFSDSHDLWENFVLDGQLSKKLSKYNESIEKISTIEQVKKLEDFISSDYNKQLLKLNNFLSSSQQTNNKKIRKLELARTDLTSTLSTYKLSLNNVSATNSIAKNLNYDISTLDSEKYLIGKTLDFLKNVRLLKNNIAMINHAIKEKNYIAAANSIHEIKKIPEHIITSEFASKVVPTSEIPDEPRYLLELWCEQLTEVFKDNFQKAAAEKNIEQLTLMFRMFPLVGQNTLGLDLYSKYVCDIIAYESRNLMTSMGNDNLEKSMKTPNFYSQVMLHLFRIVSTVINDHSKIISSSYGKKFMSRIMEKVEKEADLQAGLILDTFVESNDLVKRIDYINEWNKKQKELQSSPSRNASPKRSSGYTDPNMLDVATHDYHDPEDESTKENHGQKILVNDISVIIHEFHEIFRNWSMYTKFFSVRWNELNDIEYELLIPPNSITEGTFSTKLQNDGILEKFEVLMLYILTKSFKNTLKMEELPSLNDIIKDKHKIERDRELSSYSISSVLEDLTLLIRKNLIITVNTGQYQLLSHFMDQIAKFLQNEYLISFSQKKFRNLQPKLNSSLSLKPYLPKTDGTSTMSTSGHKSGVTPNSLSKSQANESSSTRLANLGLGFNFRGAAASALTNIQSNLQAVVSDEESILALHHYLIYINTLYLNSNYFHRILIIEVLEDNPNLLRDNFPFGNDSTNLINKIKNCEELIRTQNEKLQTWAIKYLFENVMKGKLNTMIANIFINGNENNYIATTSNYEDYSKITEFINKWKTFITPYINVLYDNAFTDLMSIIITHISSTVQRKLWSLKVNDLGATKLDREVNLFISTLCETNYTLREKFKTISQIVLIVGFDDDDFDTETNDIKQEMIDSIDWTLTSSDRIKARNLKVDRS